MPDLKEFSYRYRDSAGLHFVLWLAIGLGLVPAIITDHIFPLDGFSHRFGIDIGPIVYLPAVVCLLVFLLGVAASSIQQRYWLVPLFLPWLALTFFGVEELSFRMPTQWDAIDKLHQNQQLARESEDPPDIAVLRENIDRIVHIETGLIDVDVAALHDALDRIEEKLEVPKPAASDNATRIVAKIAGLTRKINQANRQINSINESLRAVSLLSRFSFGLADRGLNEKLRSSLRKVKRHRDQLVSQRNALRIELDRLKSASVENSETHAALRDLEGRVKTYLWASDAYQSWFVAVAYKLLCFGVLLVLIWRVALGSWVFLLTVGASLLVMMLYVEAPLSYRLWIVLKFVILSIILRALFRVFSENYPLLHRQSWEFIGQTVKTTLLYYWPFIALIVTGIAISMYADRFIDNELYKLKFMQAADPDPDAPRRYNIDRAIDVFFAEKETAALAQLEGMKGQSGLAASAVAAETVQIFEDQFKETLPEFDKDLDPPDCGGFLPWVFDTEDCAESAVLTPMNETYTETRNEQRDSLRQSTSRYAARAGNDSDKAIEWAEADLSENFRVMKRGIKKQLSYLYLAIDFYTWISALILFVLILKTVMYIFSRIFFATHGDGKRLIQFERAAGNKQSGQVQEVSDTLALEPEMGAVMYLNKKYDFANAPPDEVTPQAARGFFSRFRHGVWHMNRVHTADPEWGGYKPYRRLPADDRVVHWTLKPGDAVVFSWRSFVGMSDSIRIRTQYSWQLSSLVFGRMFFVVASVDPDSPEDGTLLLAARGSDGVGEQASPSSSPDQLLAWQTTARFKMHANLSFRNVYRSGIQIRPIEQDLAVTHLSDRKQRTGAAAFLKYFILPV